MMGWLTFLSNASQAKVNAASESPESGPKPTDSAINSAPVKETEVAGSSTPPAESVQEATVTAETEAPPRKAARRMSFQAILHPRKHHTDHKPALSAAEEHHKREHAAQAAEVSAVKEKISRSEKSAKKTALAVRALIVGPSTAAPQVTPTVVKPQLNKIKSQLMQPKSANRLINQLRQLPAQEEGEASNNGPIHAVCLLHTDEEEEQIHFAKLGRKSGDDEAQPNGQGEPSTQAGVQSAPIDQLTDLLQDMNVIDLVKSPDFGLGQPGSGPGLLAGAVPTAETVINGVKRITPELMALGFATGKALAPSHIGIYPPTDRMSVLTYWWGLELLLPPPSIAFLSNVNSVTGSVMNFLTAAALVNNGVREILPFIRYISQYIEFEFNSIKRADNGDGVVCAATWIMPAAMVPRPWDFPTKPSSAEAPAPTPLPPAGSEKNDDTKLPPIRAPGIMIPVGPLPMTQVVATSSTAAASASKPAIATIHTAPASPSPP